MRNVPVHDRPRERLLRFGSQALALPELLAIFLGTGTRDKSVLLLAQELVLKFGGIHGLLDASVEELKEIKGIGDAKAVQLKAVFAIAERAVKSSEPLKPLIRAPEDAYEVVCDLIREAKQEMILVLLRDAKGKMFHQEMVGMGTLSEVLFHPREIFHPAVKHKAFSIIVVHNHPSGDPTPSESDLELTRLLLHSSRVMSIALEDHLIVAQEGFVSLRERGFLGKRLNYEC
ncbi:MAG: DNA repair protein RadC [Chlamydiales bacterium]